MLKIKIDDRKEFIAGDGSKLREILNPNAQSVPIPYSLARAKVDPGGKTYRHRLQCSEVYYVIRGIGLMHIDSEQEPIHEHDTVFIPPGSVQYIENTGDDDLIFLCIVAPAWQPAIEQVLE